MNKACEDGYGLWRKNIGDGQIKSTISMAVDNDCNSFDFDYRSTIILLYGIDGHSVSGATKNLQKAEMKMFSQGHSWKNTVSIHRNLKNFLVTHSTYTLRDSSNRATTVATSK